MLGATGYLGSRFVDQWITEHHDSDHLIMVFPWSSLFRPTWAHPHISVIEADVSAPDVWSRLDDVDVIVHAAGPSRVRADADKNAALDAHFTGAARARDWFERRSSRRVIYLSTMHVYGPTTRRMWREIDPCVPVMPYAKLKFAAERTLGLDVVGITILRLAHVYGVGTGRRVDSNGVVHRSLIAALSKQPVQVDGTGEHAWDFVHVDDAIDALLACVRDDRGVSGVYNIGTGPTYIAHLMAEIAAVVAPITRSRFAVTSNVTASAFSCVMDSTKAQRDFGWTPRITLARGLAGLIDHYRVDVTAVIKTTVKESS